MDVVTAERGVKGTVRDGMDRVGPTLWGGPAARQVSIWICSPEVFRLSRLQEVPGGGLGLDGRG